QEAYDADGDGAVTQAEIDSTRAARLAEFDVDADGTLSITEYEALWLDAMRERMVRQFQRHDRDGDGIVTADEFQRRTANMVMLRDRNGDGALSIYDLRRNRRAEAPAAPAE
ncbi:MAG: acid-shock protein, partial [Pseudomonadota bacterium]